VLQPEQGEADQRKPDVGVEDCARVPWRKVVRSDDLDYVTGCSTQQEASRTYNGGSAHVEATPKRQKPDDREPQARGANLPLKRAICPTYEARCRLTEEDVFDEVVEIINRNRKQNEV